MTKNTRLLALALACAGCCAAAPSIRFVSNAASRIPPGFPDYGIARGSLIHIAGAELGPAERQQAGFPLPGAEGLAGTSVRVSVGATSVDALLVAVSAKQVWALLPSSTPTGEGRLTVTYQNQSATANIRVVEAAFGIFSHASTSYGPAVAFNEGAIRNSFTSSARPGQAVTIAGTGLGPISGNEFNAIGAQNLDVSVQVFVGEREAKVLSRGRAGESLEISNLPKGLAAIDQITFEAPAGVSGCAVPVRVRVQGRSSNQATISITPEGGRCELPQQNLSSELARLETLETIRSASLGLLKFSLKLDFPGLGAVDFKMDLGNADFQLIPSERIFGDVVLPLIGLSEGQCIVVPQDVLGLEEDESVDEDFPGLDAGKEIRIRGPRGSKSLEAMAKGLYAGVLGTTAPDFPGASEEFLLPGEYTIDNGSGGEDVPGFTVNATLRPPLTWSNESEIAAIDRSRALRVTWSNADPSSPVLLIGFSDSGQGSGSFLCVAPAAAGAFTIPETILSSLPASSPRAEVPGMLVLANSSFTLVQIPSMDLATISTSTMSGKILPYR